MIVTASEKSLKVSTGRIGPKISSFMIGEERLGFKITVGSSLRSTAAFGLPHITIPS